MVVRKNVSSKCPNYAFYTKKHHECEYHFYGGSFGTYHSYILVIPSKSAKISVLFSQEKENMVLFSNLTNC